MKTILLQVTENTNNPAAILLVYDDSLVHH